MDKANVIEMNSWDELLNFLKSIREDVVIEVTIEEEGNNG